MVWMTRHNYSSELKDKVIKEALETGNCALVARRHEIAKYTVNDWVRAYKKKNSKKYPEDDANHSSATNAASLEQLNESQENERLKKIIGEKDLEIAILKDLLKKTNPHLQIK